MSILPRGLKEGSRWLDLVCCPALGVAVGGLFAELAARSHEVFRRLEQRRGCCALPRSRSVARCGLSWSSKRAGPPCGKDQKGRARRSGHSLWPLPVYPWFATSLSSISRKRGARSRIASVHQKLDAPASLGSRREEGHLRRITSADTASTEQIHCYHRPQNLRPGMITLLQALRWDIEESFAVTNRQIHQQERRKRLARSSSLHRPCAPSADPPLVDARKTRFARRKS